MKIPETDILYDSRVMVMRQRTDLPFNNSEVSKFIAPWKSVSEIPVASEKAFAEASEFATEHPVAWNPRFGYITSMPDVCGSAMFVASTVHLEGLYLIGELPMVRNALDAMRMSTREFDYGDLENASHLYRVANVASLGIDEHDIVSRTQQVFADLVRQETTARVRLLTKMPRVLEDTIMRSLAMLKSCRLLSPWEQFDWFSPIRLAIQMKLIDGITLKELDRLSAVADKSFNGRNLEIEYDEELSPLELDKRDSRLADRMNAVFKDVCLSKTARRYFK